jgi:hypothetical protein
MRGDATRQCEDGPKPVELGVGVVGDRHPGVGAAEDGAGGDEDDLVEAVDPPLFAAGIGEVGEMIEDRGRVVRRGGGGRVGCGDQGADVPEGAGLSRRSIVQEAPDPRPDGLDNRSGTLLPTAPRRPSLMRKPWTEPSWVSSSSISRWCTPAMQCWRDRTVGTHEGMSASRLGGFKKTIRPLPGVE